MYAISDWLSHIFASACKEFAKTDSSRFEPSSRCCHQDLHFYGFTSVYNRNRGIGMVVRHGEVLSIGEHENGLLDGLGRAYTSDGIVEDGIFKQGRLHGIGIQYNKANNKYILGEHDNDSENFEKGLGFPDKEISEIRKEFHLRSMNFYNDVALLRLMPIFETICSQCIQPTL
jgi:hypothetical protein